MIIVLFNFLLLLWDKSSYLLSLPSPPLPSPYDPLDGRSLWVITAIVVLFLSFFMGACIGVAFGFLVGRSVRDGVWLEEDEFKRELWQVFGWPNPREH
mgnify:CR=1 FL=1